MTQKRKPYFLSKSKLLSGIQCPKRLFLEVHHPELLEVSEAAERLFKIGHDVGDIACRMFTGGKLIESQDNLSEAIDETLLMLKNSPKTPLFEATFSHAGILIRADILTKARKGHRLIEIKSATSVKDYHLDDAAIQTWVIENLGYPLDRIEIGHINNQFIYPGNEDYDGLIVFEDVKDAVREIIPNIPEWIKEFRAMLSGKIPEIEVGPQCYDPFECPFTDYCYSDETEYPVSCLPRGGTIVQELIDDGIEDIRDIPEGRLTNELHERIRKATVSGKAIFDKQLVNLLREFPYPRYYFDFETIQFTVPIWSGTKPYQQLPFQWSCHAERKKGVMTHVDFLDVSGDPPMRKLALNMISTLGDDGPIFVYSHFEKTRLNELAIMLPDLAPKIRRIVKRIVDLLPMVKKHYYHPEMKGSWSIKNLLPTVAPELNYESLTEVQDGSGAQAAYLEAIHHETTAKRKKELKERMLRYCELDSLAMVKLVRFFESNRKL